MRLFLGGVIIVFSFRSGVAVVGVGAVDFGFFGCVVGMEAGGFFFGRHDLYFLSIADVQRRAQGNQLLPAVADG